MKLRQYWEKAQERWDQTKTATVNFIETVDAIGTLMMILALSIYLAFMVLKVFAPLITFALFTGVTAWTCKGHDRLNKVLIFGGISFYLLSWKAAVVWGSWGAVGVLMLAIGFYFGAIFRAINRNHPASARITA